MKSQLCLISFVVLFLLSCSGSAPVIEELQWRVLNRDDGTNRFEEISVFLRVSDLDGAEDPALITISAGDTGLVWRFPEEDWIREVEDGTEWLGLHGIIPVSGFRLPDAQYTLRLEDLAGKSSEIKFRPDPDRLQLEQIVWPEAELNNGVLKLSGPYQVGFLILRDNEYKSLNTVSASTGTVFNFPEAEWWELWFSEKDISGGFRLGPYPVSGSNAK